MTETTAYWVRVANQLAEGARKQIEEDRKRLEAILNTRIVSAEQK